VAGHFAGPLCSPHHLEMHMAQPTVGPPPLVLPPLVIGPTNRKFDNVFTFTKDRIVDPFKNVLLAANLFNFAVDSDAPLPDHEAWLLLVAAKVMQDNPKAVAVLTGLASRTGPSDHNLDLSRRRAEQVKSTLDVVLLAPFGVPSRVEAGAQGDHFAATLNAPKKEDGRFRAVLVTILADPTLPRIVRLLAAS
jgi:outer membrane protein OmpA-like peptidoglycan-associated protein